MSGHVLDLLSAYALDALDEAEAALVTAHLAECASCRAEFATLAETAGRLADLSASDPSPQLRGRVLAAIEQARAEPAVAAAPAVSPAPQPPARPQLLGPDGPSPAASTGQPSVASTGQPPVVSPPAGQPAVAAPRPSASRRVRWGQAIAVLALAASQVWLIATLLSLRAQVALQGEAQTILLSSNETPVTLQSPYAASPARGVYHYEPDLKRGLINVYHLPPAGSGHSYQCWMEFAAQGTLPCGRLSLDPDGAGLLLFSWPAAAPSRIRVTLETALTPNPQGPTILLGVVQP